MNRFAKFYAAASAAVLIIIEALWDGKLDQGEAVAVASAVLGAFAVYAVPNADDGE